MPKRGFRGTKDKVKKKMKRHGEQKKQESIKERRARLAKLAEEREQLIALIHKNTRYARKYSRNGVAKSRSGSFLIDHERAYNTSISLRDPSKGYGQDNIVMTLMPHKKTFDQYGTEKLRRITWIEEWEPYEELGPLEKLAIAADD